MIYLYDMNTHYDTLGIGRNASIDDIKKSGFDVKQNVVKLEEFYLNSVEE